MAKNKKKFFSIDDAIEVAKEVTREEKVKTPVKPAKKEKPVPKPKATKKPVAKAKPKAQVKPKAAAKTTNTPPIDRHKAAVRKYKQSKKEVLIDNDLHDKIKAAAKKQHMTISTWVAVTIRKALNIED